MFHSQMLKMMEIIYWSKAEIYTTSQASLAINKGKGEGERAKSTRSTFIPQYEKIM